QYKAVLGMRLQYGLGNAHDRGDPTSRGKGGDGMGPLPLIDKTSLRGDHLQYIPCPEVFIGMHRKSTVWHLFDSHGQPSLRWGTGNGIGPAQLLPVPAVFYGDILSGLEGIGFPQGIRDFKG